MAQRDDKIYWDDFQSIAASIDDVATLTKHPFYTPLTSDYDQPFITPTTIPSTMWEVFEVSLTADYPMVTGRYLADGPLGGGGAPISSWPYQFMHSYIDRDYLWFLYEEDAKCYCQSLFRIINEGYGFTLETSSNNPEHGCCPSYIVPAIGSNLDEDQAFIPASMAYSYGNINGIRGAATVGFVEGVHYEYTVCGAGSDSAQVEWEMTYDSHLSRWFLTRVSRKIMGTITWPILKEHMDLMLERINEILDPQYNDGVKTIDAGIPEEHFGRLSDVYRREAPVSPDTDHWFKMGSNCCTLNYDAWLGSLCHQAMFDPTNPGTILDGHDEETECGPATLGAYSFKLPWHEATAGAQVCETNGNLKVYAETIENMKKFVESLRERIWPYGTFDTIGNNNVLYVFVMVQTSTAVFETSGGYGFVEWGAWSDPAYYRNFYEFTDSLDFSTGTATVLSPHSPQIYSLSSYYNEWAWTDPLMDDVDKPDYNGGSRIKLTFIRNSLEVPMTFNYGKYIYGVWDEGASSESLDLGYTDPTPVGGYPGGSLYIPKNDCEPLDAYSVVIDAKTEPLPPDFERVNTVSINNFTFSIDLADMPDQVTGCGKCCLEQTPWMDGGVFKDRDLTKAYLCRITGANMEWDDGDTSSLSGVIHNTFELNVELCLDQAPFNWVIGSSYTDPINDLLSYPFLVTTIAP